MKKLNNIYFYKVCCFILTLVLLNSCDVGFNEVNTNETDLTNIDAILQLNSSIINTSQGFSSLLCETTVVRQGIGPFTGVLTCANINQDNKEQESANWDRIYENVLKGLANIIQSTDSSSNIHNMARILRAYGYMVLTDTYGDIPYSQAESGLSEGTAFPKYDTQESIYTGDKGILEELANASAALDDSQSELTRDALYGGNIIKWKRFGYSLLLRAAMRLSKRKPDIAQKYVMIAKSGGLMQSNDDNAIVYHTADYTNSMGSPLNGGESTNYYLDKYFVDYLQNNDDPRLASIAVRYVGAANGNGQTEANADRDPSDQIGMPQGYDSNSIPPVAASDGLASFYAYSQIDRTRIVSQQAPTFIVTYAQTQLLLAEDVVRGWVQGNAATLFSSGIEAHMHQLAQYGENSAINENDINEYIQNHPLQSGQELEQINTQYWVASFPNGPEVWANFRRSGYPDLPPNPISGDLQGGEDFMRRLTYPNSEYSVSESAVQEAISNQGSDEIGTRIWWDKKN